MGLLKSATLFFWVLPASIVRLSLELNSEKKNDAIL